MHPDHATCLSLKVSILGFFSLASLKDRSKDENFLEIFMEQFQGYWLWVKRDKETSLHLNCRLFCEIPSLLSILFNV